MNERVFINGEEWEVVDVYTLEDAIRDGVIIPIGEYSGKKVVVTSGVYGRLIDGKMTPEEFLKKISGDLEMAMFTGIDLYEVYIEGERLWMDFDGQVFTVMFPDEY